ncbi:MAG: acetyl/propionyl/methylcrotonyl-CoA carboxylase subunit alpha [Candidatus Nanopelagicales bacterium]
MTKLLIANRGEIAVRVIRACKDEGIKTVAVYSDGDRNSMHATMADEAYSLSGKTAKETYLDIEKIIQIAKTANVDAIHPGYGFLSENADFAQAVIDAGIIWVGPPPAAITALGDKVQARHIAQKVGAPLVPGTKDPVSDSAEVVNFAKAHGLPIAIKAAFGGGGRGMKVARTIEEIPELYDSAVREAVAAFGRGECFVERYLDNPRHVETQVLADTHGNVVVISTRDCSLQRRHQKLVEEAPAPFLTDDQVSRLYEASKAIMREAGYQNAGTCEFLIGQDGTISFLEVNTRLQVEHPVSEEVTGIDLVREQLRIAQGEKIEYSDPVTRGHSIEFRINGEDPGRGFLPAPGKLTTWSIPDGPGVRMDTGYREGDSVGGDFDSLLGKLIVTGATREQALQRARRALNEMKVAGIPTALTFHQVVVNEPDFIGESGFNVHTRWIETDFKNEIAPQPTSADDAESLQLDQPIVVEVNGKRLEVALPQNLAIGNKKAAPKKTVRAKSAAPVASGNAVVAPMQGTIVKIAVEAGTTVAAGDLVMVIEAMKMEQPLTAHKSGTITSISAEIGITVQSGTVLCEITD